MKYKDEQTFTIEVTMKPRWIPHFLAMLEYMRYCGSIGRSRWIHFMVDGDGDFRPSFKYDPSLPKDAAPVRENDDERWYDAG